MIKDSLQIIFLVIVFCFVCGIEPNVEQEQIWGVMCDTGEEFYISVIRWPLEKEILLCGDNYEEAVGYYQTLQ